MGWLAVGDVTAAAPEHPVVVVSADGTGWQAADGERVFGATGLFTEQAAADAGGYVIVGHQNVKRVQNGRVVATRTKAAVWWSATLNDWRRGGDATAGALDGTGNRQMNAVTALPVSGRAGFVAVGSHGDQPSAWTSADGGRSLAPGRSAHAGRLHPGHARPRVASTAASWSPWAPPSPPRAGRCRSRLARPTAAPAGPNQLSRCPPDLTSVTALVTAGGTLTATGSYGSTPGHQDVVVWTSADGSAWQGAEPGGKGLTGLGIQAITGLAAAGNTLTGVGFTASPVSQQPIFWQAPIR